MNPQHIHFIGIGGIGMSALARLFLAQGKTISGSDSADAELIHELKSEGMTVHIGHDAKNVPPETAMVVYSNAVPEKNPERLEAKQRKLPVVSYFEALGQCTKGAFTLAVCGTHGKSTTTALLALGLIRARFDPSVIIGTKLREFGNKNMRKGRDSAFVVEACEYRRAFLSLHPSLIIITNMETEHLDYYRDFADYTDAFRSFIKKLPGNGVLVFPYDDEAVRKLAKEYKGEKWSFGRNPKADVRLEGDKVIINKRQDRRDCFASRSPDSREDAFRFLPAVRHGTPCVLAMTEGPLSLQIPGEHNRKNALAALTGILAFANISNRGACFRGNTPPPYNFFQRKKRIIPFRSRMTGILSAFHDYQGAWRRFEYRGKFQGAKVYDDYAHHPTEIQATLQGARELFPKNRIIVVFQPHQFNRTKNLFKDFAHAWNQADTVIIPNIYEVRDQKKDKEGTSAKDLVIAIRKNHPNVEYTQTFDTTIQYLKKNIQKNDVLIIMGAGDVYKITDVIATPHPMRGKQS